MPQDPNLYGQPAPKRRRQEMDLSSSLSFSSQLSALLAKPPASSSSSTTAISSKTDAASPTTTTTSGRVRPSKAGKDVFAGVKVKRKDNNDGNSSRRRDASPKTTTTGRLRMKSPTGTFDSEREREAARLNMEAKARLYAAMKRGDYVPSAHDSLRGAGGGSSDRGPLVDFDRKWAEKHLDKDGAPASSSSGDDDDSDGGADEEGLGENDTELISYTDEFGRTRRGTRAEVARRERQARAGVAAAAELEAMSARPAAPAPSNLIWGDEVQASAFVAADEVGMEALARKRDRSATPPEATHYDASREVRGRGVGFYAFSAHDDERRQKEMEALAAERAETERVRREKEEKAGERKKQIERRKREIEERRRDLGERRARKLADSFLDGLGMDLGGGSGGGGGEPAGASGDGDGDGAGKTSHGKNVNGQEDRRDRRGDKGEEDARGRTRRRSPR